MSSFTHEELWTVGAAVIAVVGVVLREYLFFLNSENSVSAPATTPLDALLSLSLYSLCFLTGILLVWLPQLLLLVVFWVIPSLGRIQAWNIKKPLQAIKSHTTTRFFKQQLKTIEGQKALWLTAFIGRLYSDLHGSKVKTFFEDLVIGEIADLYRDNVGCFLGTTQLIHGELGASAPSFKNIKVLTEVEEDSRTTTLVASLELQGPVVIHIETSLLGLNLPIELAVSLSNIQGELILEFSSFPENTLGFGFPEAPSSHLNATILVAGRKLPMATWIVSMFIQSLLRRKFILPHLKYRYLFFDAMESKLKSGFVQIDSARAKFPIAPGIMSPPTKASAPLVLARVWLLLKPNALTFYQHDEIDKPFGSIPLAFITEMKCSMIADPVHAFRLDVRHGDFADQVVFQCENHAEALEWMLALNVARAALQKNDKAEDDKYVEINEDDYINDPYDSLSMTSGASTMPPPSMAMSEELQSDISMTKSAISSSEESITRMQVRAIELRQKLAAKKLGDNDKRVFAHALENTELLIVTEKRKLKLLKDSLEAIQQNIEKDS